MSYVPPRSLAAMGASAQVDERPSFLALLARRAVAALLPPPRLVPRVRYATLIDGRPARR